MVKKFDIKSLDLSADVFDKPYNEALIHQVVTARLAGLRAGTHQQKTRAEVSGGGAKPWNQKGSGRARAGTTRGPLWRHGGVTFAARPGDYSQKINKKMYRGALCSILSQLIRDERLLAVEEIKLTQSKTKELVSFLAKLKAEKPLIIVDEIDEKLVLASRNLLHTEVISVRGIDPVFLLRHENVVITKQALVKLNEALQHG
ncbi:MAG TPA: 50S ribosomal protein L4 [Gammaproteobacteria bacterium]|nr:50S ribosomal protein L4 [Gammaproteobacteria bacterium]